MPSLNPIGTPFVELLSVESTNNYAMGLVRAGLAQQGMAVFAHRQTKGKGQRNRQWASEDAKNIALSIVAEPFWMSGQPLFLLSMIAACGVRHFLEKYMGDEVKIKWPNDIYWRDRKAAGILIENVWQGNEWKFAVIGIGINVNQTEFGDLGTKAVSIKQVTGSELEPLNLAKELCTVLQEVLASAIIDPMKTVAMYREHLFRAGETIRLKKDNRIFDAELVTVNLEGQLVVHTAVEESFDVGEVEWLIKNNDANLSSET